MNNVTNNAIDDLLQIVKAYVNQNAELKAVVAQQKQQIAQLQQQKEVVKKSEKNEENRKDDRVKRMIDYENMRNTKKDVK